MLVLAFAGQLIVAHPVSQPPMPLGQALSLSVVEWFAWALLAPLVAWLAIRFPLERQTLGLNLPIHIVACGVAVVLCALVPRPTALRPLGPSGGRPPPPRGEGRFPPPDPERDPDELPPNRPPRQPANRPSLFIRSATQARVNVPIYWIIVSIAHALTFYRRSQERENKALELEARLTDAKLQALRMQLHPHFLFNTLNAISTLVHKDPAAADEMIANLSELLRATLDTTTQEISLRQELNLLNRYLEIQQARFGQRLRVEKEIDAASLDAQVPTLVLQPLVENAIRHGIEPNPAPGQVKIGAHLKEGKVRLTVRDNGIGAKAVAKDREGIGIANTKARLEALYGESARLILSTASEGGFTVEIELPFHQKTAAS